MTTLLKDKAAARKGRANPARMFSRTFGPSTDPRRDDMLAETTALALCSATGAIKQLASAGSISGKRASAWRRSGQGNPLHDLTLIVDRLTRMGQHPHALVVHLCVTITHALIDMRDEDLIQRWEAVCDEEAEAATRARLALLRLPRGGDLAAVERADQEQAERLMERSALAREMRRRGLDPRR